jgi:predicted ATPase
LFTQIPTARILAVFTARPEFTPPWPPRSHLTMLTLPRLGPRHVEEMAKKVARGTVLPSEVLQQVLNRTDGIPLFVEEFTKMVLESGSLTECGGRSEWSSPSPPLAIPVTLQDSLMARLDRLSAVKEVTQLGATLGREFSYELLQAVSSLEDATLQRELTRLAEAELLYQTGVPPQATYLFKHALIREAAYESLLKSTRQRYHQQIARVLAERFPEVGAAQPELLAHHHTEAGLREEAIGYWQQAGQRAMERWANEEAIGHLTQALALLEGLPDTPERAQHELALHVLRGTPLLMARGYAAPEVAQAYARARELCQHLGAGPQLLPALAGLVRFHLARAEFHTARELGEQLLRLAEGGSEVFVLAAHALFGVIFVRLGDFATARGHLEHGLALYDRQQHGFLASVYGDDPGVACLAYLAAALWYLGYPDQALQKSGEALALAQDLSIPYPRALALGIAAWVHLHRREGETAQEYARALVALATEQGFPFWAAEGTVTQGWAWAALGRREEGIAQMRQGLAMAQATGTEMARPSYLAHLAGTYGEAGRAAEGLPVLAEALAVIGRTGECIYAAELHRLQGELRLQQAGSQKPSPGAPKEAEGCFQTAIETARRQSAKSLELRAVMSLSRLWQKQGKQAEARQLLTEIYGWFTEGFDTKDLQEAKILLEELA